MKKGESIDIGASITHFFELKDWVNRTLFIGGFLAIIIAVSFFMSFLFIIPIIGWIIGCFLTVVVIIGSLLYAAYLEGYKLELIKAISTGKSMETVSIAANYSMRFKKGAILMLANFIYVLPIVLLYVIGFGLMFAPLILTGTSTASDVLMDDTSGAAAADAVGGTAIIFSSLLFYLIIFIGIIYQMLQQYMIYPPMIIQYVKKGTFGSMFEWGVMWEFMKNNWVNMLIYAVLTFGAGIVLWFANMIGVFTLLICIGFILLPIIWAVGTVYILHLQAHMLGQMARGSK
ncbi:MAG: DUF4013 domain-containing protein [Candidatus Dojkabacteria bacterium]